MEKLRERQVTNTVVMISPDQFGFNPETAETNYFQNKVDDAGEIIRNKALKEFDETIKILRKNDIRVLVLPSRTDVITPDAVFPNNWFSHHEEGLLITYPMLVPNRRSERQVAKLEDLLEANGIKNQILDISAEENQGRILEGTGSVVLDRENRIAYAMESSRTTKGAFEDWCEDMNYEGVFFHAYDKNDLPIYHTNVVMSIGESFAVACIDAIKNPEEKKLLVDKITQNGKQLIPITLGQVYSFCGNILELCSKEGESKIVMSTSAFDNFTVEQKAIMKKYGQLIAIPIPTIEKVGGGSARCMLAEIFIK